MRRPRVTGPTQVVVLAAALAAAVRLLLLAAPLSPDEAGFLLIARQWSPGRSLYGDYWVDRPPGLLALFALAHGATGLRLLGVLAAVVSVLLAARLARTVAPDRRWAPATTAGLVAALVSSRLLDVTMVDGEVLALPFLLAGLVAALRATLAPRGHLGWALAAGAAGAAALSVKQNLADVVVAVACLAVVLAVRRRPRAALLLAGGAVVGAALTGAVVLGLAWTRGTSPPALWDAVVLFRLRAADVLSAPTHAAATRARDLGLALVLTGAPLVLLRLPELLHRPGARRGPVTASDPLLGWVAAVLVAWELVSVTAGGSFWLHYLVGLVPGLALVLALTTGHRSGHLPALPTWTVLGATVTSAVVGLGVVLVHPPSRPAAEVAVTRYLRDHAHLGRTAVVTFGHPSILEAAGMRSPYPLIWSLPMRVEDPRLRQLAPLIRHRRAQWVLVDPRALTAWGLDGTRAERLLARNYRPAFRSGDLVVWRAVRPGHAWHPPTV
ncbi:hypothetical protein [Nocardioides marmoribigeumensis]|uniref:4-amino-4-deoxy-L-arabinose transferase-like glycosyltransferase n=1 Tax=Nocardioides marmoribigeumensis TaxID=433649 RepID=A0ABU2BUT9_9ACTN|nr:hypothetical protein [Nocardioides marmoribigeumensis]MDR7362400.1 4-amino-4-deoxy-L-arabinose transferase-like glycosyltransferase [Nocardioides marmoribigeumensis]